jgi:hypothetical protein
MLKIMAGTLVALVSAGLLLLGCTTKGLGEIGTSRDKAGAPSASPSTSSEFGPELDGHFDSNEIPQAL